MLFIFEAEGLYSFWMKGMVIPLDLVWIDADGVVSGVTASVPHAPEGTIPQLYFPPRPIQYVLEINAGLAEAVGIGAGSQARVEPDLRHKTGLINYGLSSSRFSPAGSSD